MKMIQKKWHTTLIAIAILIAFSACRKEGKVTGGSISHAKVNMTTYDYLKTNPLFDTLVLLINRAGLKDTVNSSITFFAPTDYSIDSLMKRRTELIRIKYNNESLKYTIDSFAIPELRDSLRAYMFRTPIKRESLGADDNLYTNLIGQPFSVRLLESVSYTSDIINTRVKYLFLIKIINGRDPFDNTNVPEKDRDQRSIMQTTGILTTTGVLHVINNFHVFYWD